jgi:hypothetical protein
LYHILLDFASSVVKSTGLVNAVKGEKVREMREAKKGTERGRRRGK